MKNIIAVTACLKRYSIAISYGDNIYEANENMDASSNLVWSADNLIKANNIDLQKIDGVITISGPGSFTGIRVAQSFAKGLALSLNIPIAAVSYFEIIERKVKSLHYSSENEHTPLLIIIKSEMNNIYYRYNDEVGVASCESFKDKVNSNCILAGDAIEEVSPYLKDKIIRVEYVCDFRDAKYLCDFSAEFKSHITPLYINIQSSCK
ncbi:MAG: tRNA (adenosine(37)-N6)-threonylcarbamoyltransferase complex dimerization subunit type 1 TsaB [Holosporaceae bacterium]|jgi:tRNA threonylcarbamoyl adenosine modification protein YeaZ|nr:tRNA (adenosine(37)-N6)-threonylcarbamoyltransferase complex dimerization subunit type 1 TsaB [Holosporaceae bacterium]